ncbi:MAG: hypothetical protein K2X27_00705 [Candidatus Obscuribacterales bacterium]|nr:hypothetical protein [Candidatus Obscuribacterales bacterium]
MSKIKGVGKVGDLLVESGLLSREDLNEGMNLSASLGLPIGKTMVMSGVLSEKVVRSAVLIQSMMKDGLIEREMAVQALARSGRENLPVEECLIELGWKPMADLMVNKVGQLLVDGGALTKAELKEALNQVNTMGLPLGRILVLTGKVKGSVIWCALNSQMLLRENKISRKQAVNAVKAVHERQASFEQGLREQGIEDALPEHRIKLGELLVLSGLVGEEDILGAVEESVVKEKPLGHVLVQMRLLSQERLSDALKLQEMTDNKTLSPLQAVDVLRTIQNRNQSLNKAVAELGLMKAEIIDMKLGELLKLCGWISEQEIDEAIHLAAKNSNLLGKMLVAFGYIDENMLYNSLRCQFLVREGFIKREQAIIALHYSQRTRCSLDNALLELGLTKPTVPETSE